jgi:bifunctional oligoribonuclease and PAP phosphatase NrnA
MIDTWTQRPAPADWDAVVRLLLAVERPVLVAHVSPDGDALGSALAVAVALRDLGRTPVVSFGDDPQVVPDILDFLPGLAPGDVVAAPELVVTFDASSTDRLGLLAPKVAAAGTVVAVDHHTSYTGFADVHVVDTTAPATAVLARELVERLGGELTAEVATAIYAGLLTDTGSFRYAATTPSTHELAAELLRAGVAHDAVARRIYDTTPFGYLQVLGDALRRAELDLAAVGGLGLVSTTVTVADRVAHGLAMDAVEPLIDTLRVAQEAEVAVVLKEHEDGTLRVSTRSRGRIDMSAVCLALGGGGHRLAAGFTSHDDAATTVARLKALLASAPHADVAPGAAASRPTV